MYVFVLLLNLRLSVVALYVLTNLSVRQARQTGIGSNSIDLSPVFCVHFSFFYISCNFQFYGTTGCIRYLDKLYLTRWCDFRVQPSFNIAPTASTMLLCSKVVIRDPKNNPLTSFNKFKSKSLIHPV